MIINIINFCSYQIVWFGAIYYAAKQQPNIGVWLTVIFLTLHFLMIKNKRQQLMVLLVVAFIGVLTEWLVHSLFAYSFNTHDQFFIPLWLIGIWLCFSCTLLFSLNLIIKRAWTAILCGVIFGPLSYYGAQSLGAITINGSTGILILAITWGLGLLLIHKYLIR